MPENEAPNAPKEEIKEEMENRRTIQTLHFPALKQTSSSPSTPPPNTTPPRRISLRHRLKHFTFAWFLCTMSTGGLSIALALTPHQFPGLHTIGLSIFLINIALFLLFTSCMICRGILYPKHVRATLSHPSEALFLGSWWLSISVVIGGIQVYGIDTDDDIQGRNRNWLVPIMYVLYWIYATLSLINSLSQYLVLFSFSSSSSSSRHHSVPLTPAIFIPGYSTMLTGTIASLVAPTQPPHRAYQIVLSGLAFQGSGWLLSSVCIVLFILGLLNHGLPTPSLRPALFIPVGSVAYTVLAVMGLADAIPVYGFFATHAGAKETCRVLALVVGVFMWLFGFWLFAFAVGANVYGVRRMGFGLGWWAFIFPNVGFMLSTGALGRALDSLAVLWLASVLTVLLVGVWLVTGVGCVWAVWTGRIVFPGRDEDKNV